MNDKFQYDLRVIYLFAFFVMLMLYGVNKVLALGSLKLFYVMIPLLYSIYFLKYDFEVSKGIRIIFIFIFAISISMVNTMIFHIDALGHVVGNLLRLYIVILMLIPMYGFYVKDDRLFNIFIIIFAAEMAFANIFHYFFVYDFADRFQGTFGGANEFAFTLVSLIYYTYFSFYRTPNLKMKWLFIIALILLHVVVLFTLSRTAILGTIIFYFISLPYFHKHVANWQKIVIFIFIFIGIIVAVNTFEKTIELMIERFTGEKGAGSIGSRYYEIMAGINLLADNPISVIFGTGMSISGSEIFPDFYRGIGGMGTRIHNSYSSMIIEDGLFTMFSFIYFISYTLKKIFLLKDDFKYVMLAFMTFILIFLSTIYLLYFLPFWLALFMITAHIDILNNKP